MKLLKILIVSLIGVISVNLPAHAVIEIDITRGNVQPLPIAIAALVGSEAEMTTAGSVRQIGEQIAQVVGIVQRADAEIIAPVFEDGDARVHQ